MLTSGKLCWDTKLPRIKAKKDLFQVTGISHKSRVGRTTDIIASYLTYVTYICGYSPMENGYHLRRTFEKKIASHPALLTVQGTGEVLLFNPLPHT